MPVFISYSHQDKDFVDKLAANLVMHKARVWIDRWELNVGDSIIDKIQEAIQESDALIIVISSSSMKSEWCKKELSAGFLRELEEKRVIVLPLLLEECEMPIFLKGKQYADFRDDFDKGLMKILEAIAKVTSDSQGRFEKQPEYSVDWAMDWGFTDDGLFHLRLQNKDLHFVLDDNFPKIHRFKTGDPNLDIIYDVVVTSRWIGEDTGKSVFIDYGNHLITIKRQLERSVKDFK